jgi:hypothetical protein
VITIWHWLKDHRALATKLLLILAVAAMAGCGLDDYEKLVLYQQERLENIDKENKWLGPPIVPPPRRIILVSEERPTESSGEGADERATKQPTTLDFDLFLRPPSGIASKPDDKPWAGLFYHYANTGTSFGDMLIATATNATREDFWREIFNYYGTYDTTTNPIRPEKKQPFDRQPLEFETFVVPENRPPQPVDHNIFLYQGTAANGKQAMVAVVFVVPQANAKNQAVQTAIDLSLKSLAIGNDALTKRKMFRSVDPSHLGR